ncbi:hypothetical protein Btru_074681 [Bulinus truncatus]|nr:hypothetical protein Btru_074681 [Bulinus truncatus]
MIHKQSTRSSSDGKSKFVLSKGKVITSGTSLLREFLRVFQGVMGFKEGIGKIFLDKKGKKWSKREKNIIRISCRPLRTSLIYRVAEEQRFIISHLHQKPRFSLRGLTRNTKIMRKAVMDDKLNTEKYKEAIAKMDEYVSLQLRENVKNAATLDDDVYDVLNKMENLQNQRARKWAKQMDQMGSERLKLANVLMGDSGHHRTGVWHFSHQTHVLLQRQGY